MDILPYTPEEFEKKKHEIGIVKEALSEGIILEDKFPERAAVY